MATGPPDRSERSSREPIQDVYEQYWWHARHVENQVWSYTRIWAVVLTGIFTVVGSDLPNLAKASAAGFGSLLSVLGIFMVYSLRVPFLAFALKTELIALDKFGLEQEYARFFDADTDFRQEKSIDTVDVLLLVYGLVGVVLSYVAMFVLGYEVVGVVVPILMASTIVWFYRSIVLPEWADERRDAHQLATEEFERRDS